MPRVLNIRTLPGYAKRRPVIREGAVYVGRLMSRYRLKGSKWANVLLPGGACPEHCGIRGAALLRPGADGAVARAGGARSVLLVCAVAVSWRCAPEAGERPPIDRFARAARRAYMNRHDHRPLRVPQTAAAREEGSACGNHRAGGCATG